MIPDPFAHHPALRGKITDPLASFWRSFQPRDMDDRMRAIGRPADWRYPDALREQMWRDSLGSRFGRDLWVFGYGSLMWDPGFQFAEVRHGTIRGYARRFCLKDTFGARGTPEAPGLMAALDAGPGCAGLVFRIDAAQVEAESEVVWRREMIAPAYRPVFAEVTTSDGPVEALTFAANHDSEVIFPDLPHAEQVRYLATGCGFLGSSRAYLENIAAQFAALDIDDKEVSDLLTDVQAFAPAPQT